jgi:phosphatidate phosphatase LPIN
VTQRVEASQSSQSFLALAPSLSVWQWEKYLIEGVHWTRSPAPTPAQLASLALRDGENTLTFEVMAPEEAADGAPLPRDARAPLNVSARAYLWSPHAKIVVSDVDGTITKSDVLGHLFASIGRDWTHTGVARLYTHIQAQGYNLMYLTARAIGQAHGTKEYLANIKQGERGAPASGGGGGGGGGVSLPSSPARAGAAAAAPAPPPPLTLAAAAAAVTFQLPGGPVFTSPDRFFTALTREVISRTPHEFKIAALSEVRALFPPDVNPFFAGFGNRDTDVTAYRAVGVPEGHIYLVNPAGELRQSGGAYCKSYTTIDGLLQEMFPAVAPLPPEGPCVGSRYGTPVAHEPRFDDPLYWRAPLAALSREELKAAMGGGAVPGPHHKRLPPLPPGKGGGK